MKIRRCNHLHFISAIRQGQVTKSLNVTRGKPALKFKSIQEICCAAQVSGNYASLVGSDKKGSRCRRGSRSAVVKPMVQSEKDENSASNDGVEDGVNYRSSNAQSHSSFDELNFDIMTSNPPMDECKAKKRKASRSVGRTKQASVGLEPDNEVLDSDETLGNWTFKLSRKTKANKRRKLMCVPPGGNTTVCKSEEIMGDQDFKASSVDIDMSISTKSELLEHQHVESQGLTPPPPGESSTNSGLPLDILASKVVEMETSECSHIKQGCLSSLTESTCCGPTEEDCDMAAEDGNACFPNSDSSSVLEKLQACERNHVSYHHPAEGQASSSSLESSNKGESMAMDDLRILADQYSPAMAVVQQEDASFPEAESPNLVNGKLQLMEPCHNVDVCRCPVGSGDLTATSNGSPKTVFEMDLQDYDSPITREKETTTSNTVNGAVSCFCDSYSCDAAYLEPRPTADGSSDHVEQRRGPRRLFSGRTTISPTSQEKLSKLVNSTDLHDETDAQECKKRLSSERQGQSTTHHAVPKLETDETIDMSGTESTSAANVGRSPRKARRVKNGKKFPRSKCNAKNPKPSQSLRRFSSGCNSIQACSQSAIVFSQQQMLDFERLAKMLTDELHTVKEMLEKTLQSETRTTFTVMRCNRNQARVAVEHATKVEDMTKKWLSMMTRDCNRFCRIMSLVETHADSSSSDRNIKSASGETLVESSAAQRERRVSFADEAGGTLSEVRFYEDSDSFPLEELQP